MHALHCGNSSKGIGFNNKRPMWRDGNIPRNGEYAPGEQLMCPEHQGFRLLKPWDPESRERQTAVRVPVQNQRWDHTYPAPP